MKKIFFYIFCSCIISLFFVQCESLDLYPLDKIHDENYWRNATDIELFANQFYPMLFDAHQAWIKDNQSDNQSPSNKEPYTWGLYSVPFVGGGWSKADWSPIRSVNHALNKIQSIENKDVNIRMAEGEIWFFKAYLYFEKMKRFGDVPYYEKPLQDNDSLELYKPRDSRVLVFDKIIQCLDTAISYLPETSSKDRLTKYAALALKADICLYEGTFRKYHNIAGDYLSVFRIGADACETIINSNLFSIYKTGDINNDYKNLFIQKELKNNREGIMVQRYLLDKRMHNNTASLSGPGTGYTKDFVLTYLCKDGLPISKSPLYRGDAKWGDEFVDRDPRMQQSIYDGTKPFMIFEDGTFAYRQVPEFLTNFCNTGYYIMKGYSHYIADSRLNMSVIDDFIYRYGVVLVSYAEIKAELGECTQEVLDISINQLRSRVGMPKLLVNFGFEDPNWPKWEMPISPLLNEIRRERRVETCAEGRRWDDLVRWKAGKLLENPMTILGARNPRTNSYQVLYPGSGTRIWFEKNYLYPIPIQELTLNKLLVQNPGWPTGN